MKKKVAILGSTGSIGKTTVEIIKKDKKNFEVVLLTSNNNHKELLKQFKKLKPKNLIINNFNHYTNLKKKLKKNKVNIYNNFGDFKKNNKKKIDYTMCAISGLSGLKPTLEAIKFSKKIAVANKESLICGWNLIESSLKKNQTKFIPVDSEHFSIMNLLNGLGNFDVEEVLITASGGPFLNLPLNKFKSIKPINAVKHPNWKMGKKISIDSATLMNKVFEIIEAKKIFNIELKKFKIVIHPKSYVHAVVKFKNGLTKILIHDTNMKIPIFNSIYSKDTNHISSNKINFEYLNNLDFKKVNLKKFPSVKLIKKVPFKNSLFETVIVSANDELVNLFLRNKIKFNEIFYYLNKITNLKNLTKFKEKTPKNFDQIYKLSEYVRLKTRSLSI
tara:strand:+ start:3510 stop:4673 length:1164 start_codon:yes stop_codon:yes gene_type:complete